MCLGVRIFQDFKWNAHVSNACTEANRTIDFITRNLSSCPKMLRKWQILEYHGYAALFGTDMEALPRGGGGVGTCSPEIFQHFPSFPKIKIFIFYVPCSPKLHLFPCSLHFRLVFPCSPEINNIIPLVPHNPWEGLYME